MVVINTKLYIASADSSSVAMINLYNKLGLPQN